MHQSIWTIICMTANNHYFIDSSYVIALEIYDDQHHSQALSHWRRLLKKQIHLTTTSFVFDEVVTFMNAHGQHQKAIQVGSYLLNSPSVRMVFVEKSLFHEGWLYLKKYADKRYSLTDCISFLVMKRLELNVALTFDKHFTQAGFQVQPTSVRSF
jgi:predicted nucleic acid-binding protein